MAITQTELENQFLAAQQAEAKHVITVVNALIDQKLGIHEVDFDALAAKVNSINTLLDGDPNSDGYQAFAALTQKLSTVEATAANNAQSIANLQSALTSQIASVTARLDQVEADSQAAREALDARITTLSQQHADSVAAQLAKNTAQDTRLDDHQARIEALEAAKALHDSRLTALESDNTANKSAITALQTTVAAQADALQQELSRAQAAEAEIRGELATERARIDALTTASGDYATRSDVAAANTAGAMSFVNALWSSAGMTMPSGLPMPNGSTSA